MLTERRARRALKKLGIRLHKSRQRTEHLNNWGHYMLVDDRNCVVAGSRYDMTLEDIAQWLNAK